MKYAFLASLVCGGLATLAQAQETKTTPPSATPSRPLMMTNMMPPGMGGRPMMRDRTDMLARMLNLTDEQKIQVKPIIDEETKQIDEIRTKTQEKLKPILTPEQYSQLTRMGPGPGGMGMPPRMGPGPTPPNVQMTPPGTAPVTPAK